MDDGPQTLLQNEVAFYIKAMLLLTNTDQLYITGINFD